MSEKPDWEAFGKGVMESWPECGLDGFELQDLAFKHGIILEVPGGFDPAKHEDLYGCAEPGCQWFQRNYS